MLELHKTTTLLHLSFAKKFFLVTVLFVLDEDQVMDKFLHIPEINLLHIKDSQHF